ncbi:HTTM domain-containing protein [Halobacterium sp. R2-5]|uniref:HTTM domain-containing protein n=1 Tax=Halobacterium sp. R2-5 TaxID=2715751 RepID=UPI003263EF4E
MTGRLRAAVARRLGVDARALAALRVALAGIVLVDLALRTRYLAAFYTDAGVYPRSLLVEQYGSLARLSVHALSGAAWVQALLFLATAAAALAMLAGYRTTLATLATGLLVGSLHYRNPLVLNSGDTLLRMLFLWAIFAPLGERWSVDALRSDSDARERVLGVATAGLLLQVVVVYTVNAVLKLRGELWLSGEAVRQVLELDMFTVLLGEMLSEYPAVVVAFDRLWLAMLTASVFLVVSTGWLRAGFAALFAAMHAGMLVSMQLAVFPLVSIAALLPFLPAKVWDRLPGWRAVPALRTFPLSEYAHRVEHALPVLALPALPAVVVRWKNRVAPALLAVLLAGLLVWNAATVGAVDVPEAGPVDGQPEPRWSMFAPTPVGTDYWVVAPGRLDSGGSVDAFHGGPVQWSEPPDVAGSYPSSRWRKYVANVRSADDQSVPDAFAGYLCTRWNERSEDELRSVSVFVVEQDVRSDDPPPTDRVTLANVSCSA